MPYADLSQARLYYVADGPASAPALLLSNSLGANADMWARQVPDLTRRLRVVRYDTRGHGRSSAPEGEYRFEQLARDALELLDHLGIARAHCCGLSMGGPTMMQLALDYPERVGKLVLCNTAARIGSVESWTARMQAVAQDTLAAMAPELAKRWLSEDYRRAQPGLTQILIDMLRRTSDSGYIANCAALRDGDLRALAALVRAPTLVISGTHDVAATPLQGRELAESIPGARYAELDAAHLSNWEQPEAYTRLLLDFLQE
jgi:3-oxoadipate enol-lactonase